MLIAERFTVCLMYIYFKIVNVDMFTVWLFTVCVVCGQVYSVWWYANMFTVWWYADRVTVWWYADRFTVVSWYADRVTVWLVCRQFYSVDDMRPA